MNILDRLAGAPITWGVDGSPGWGYLMDCDRVLSEMKQVGLHATELGPAGYLGKTPTEVSQRVAEHGLELVAGFVPCVLYRPELWEQELANFRRDLEILKSGGAEVAVLGTDSHLPGYDHPIDLSPDDWNNFFAGMERLLEIAEPFGMSVALHQHWGMAVHSPEDLKRVLDTVPIRLCIDTGHLALVGADPAEIARQYIDRVDHVHLKDVSPAIAAQVRSGKIGFRAGVMSGLFQPLGQGDVDFGALFSTLIDVAYDGWWVLEQDLALTEPPGEDAGPQLAVQQSIDYLIKLVESI